jgi:hypothetical protein
VARSHYAAHYGTSIRTTRPALQIPTEINCCAPPQSLRVARFLKVQRCPHAGNASKFSNEIGDGPPPFSDRNEDMISFRAPSMKFCEERMLYLQVILRRIVQASLGRFVVIFNNSPATK